MIYKITLTPLERFFFGGENVFGSENGQDERRRSYLVKSNFLPQQTTLLGLLRERLLTQNNLLISGNTPQNKINDAVDLVGNSGFSPSQGGNPYGLIQAISPLVLTDENGEVWQPAPLDDRLTPDRNRQLAPLKFAFDPDSGKGYLQNHNPKENYDLLFGNAAGNRRSLETCFTAFEQVGIRMTNRLKHKKLPVEDRQDAFYHQTFRGNGVSAFGRSIRPYSENTSAFSFTFWVDFHDDIRKYQLSEGVVYMGGERSAFNMKMEQVEGPQKLFDFSALPYQHNVLVPTESQRFSRFVLQSDTFADWDILKKNVVLAVTQTVPFRFFTTFLDKTRRFYDFSQKDPTTRNQSSLHYLLQRGSVLYADGEQAKMAIKNELDRYVSYQKIGYNYYSIVN